MVSGGESYFKSEVSTYSTACTSRAVPAVAPENSMFSLIGVVCATTENALAPLSGESSLRCSNSHSKSPFHDFSVASRPLSQLLGAAALTFYVGVAKRLGGDAFSKLTYRDDKRWAVAVGWPLLWATSAEFREQVGRALRETEKSGGADGAQKRPG